MIYNPFNLKDKTILVTGASSGIGRTIAIECSKMGASLIVLGRNIERLTNVYDSLEGNNHKFYVVDLENIEQVQEMILTLPSVNGIVHAAGINQKMPLKYINSDKLQEIFNVNVYSSLFLTQNLLKKKKLLKSGSVVFISSISSTYASIGNIVYMASKGAVTSMSRGIALELSRQQIRVNTIEPGMILTNLIKDYSEETILEDLKNYPLGRYGNTLDVAYGAIYLLSDAAQWVTGTSITIDGSVTLR